VVRTNCSLRFGFGGLTVLVVWCGDQVSFLTTEGGGYKSIDRSDSLLTYVQSLNTTKRALDAEVSEHLGDDKNAPVINPAGNARNGKSKKTLTGRAIVFKL
jgi:hypothetical protein